jgi:hypothetical protein
MSNKALGAIDYPRLVAKGRPILRPERQRRLGRRYAVTVDQFGVGHFSSLGKIADQVPQRSQR